MEHIQVGVESVYVLSSADLAGQAKQFGLPDLESTVWLTIAIITNDRIAQRLTFNLIEAIRFSAFSYLVEIARLWPECPEMSQACF